MYHDSLKYGDYWKRLLALGLSEDGSPWDWSTRGVGPSKGRVSARVIAKSTGIWAGDPLVAAVEALGSSIKIRSRISDGKAFMAGEILTEIQASIEELFAFERPFLNLASFVGGIATATSTAVSLVRKACPKNSPRVVLTRKTLPGYRDLSIHGVLAGGGFPHRVSLAGGVLLKENHIAAAGSIERAMKGARREAPHGLKIEIEVRNERELLQALKFGAEGVLLDNFSPAEVRKALKRIQASGAQPFVEISGGINEKNISEYAIEGVHVLSLGSLTHSVKSLDLSWLI